MRTALFWVVIQRKVLIPYRRFETTCLLLLKSQESKNLGFLTLEDGTENLSRNVGNKLPLIFTVVPCILILSSFLFIQLNAQLGYSRLRLTLKFTLKYSYMFRLTNHHQGAYCRALLKL